MSLDVLQEKPLDIQSALLKTDTAELAKDQLSLLPYARALRTFIEDCPTPMSIGIQGDWGTGKTSLLNMLRGREDKRTSGLLTSSKCLVVNFETWSYSQFNSQKSLPTACLFALTNSLGEALKREKLLDDTKSRDILDKASGRLLNVIKNINVGVPGISIPAGKILDDGEEFTPPPDDFSQEMLKFKYDFENLVKLWVERKDSDNKNRVVICIDDLDRITPVVALEMLEAIKNFLDVTGCVFILAVDFEVIQAGMAQKLGSDVQKSSGKSFFDKMIQLPFNMPKDSYDLESYIGELIKETGLPQTKFIDLKYLREITATSVGSNPRSIKRVMNYARLINLIRDENKDREKTFTKLDTEILYTLICLQIAWPELFTLFISEPSPEMIVNMENWEYLEQTPQLKPLFDRVPDEERLKNNISTFFDTLFENLDEKKDGHISQEEFEPVTKVLQMAQFTSIDMKQRPRDALVQQIKENAERRNDILDFMDNVFNRSNIFLNPDFVYRKSGTRYVTLVYKRKQFGSLVTLKTNPLVIRLHTEQEALKSEVRKKIGSKNEDGDNLDQVIRGLNEDEATLTGFGDTIVDIMSLMKNKSPDESLKLLNIITESTASR